MFIVSSRFIAKFKIGDNVHYNLQVLAQLYRHFGGDSADDRKLLCKPITILLVSIIEAFLYDIHFRGGHFTTEGIVNAARSWLEWLRSKNVDDFGNLNGSARKYNLLAGIGGEIYDNLDELRKLRNRIHIQNSKGELEADDAAAFTLARMTAAEKALEKVAKYFAAKYPRPERVQGYVADFEFPWNEHFPRLSYDARK